MIGRLTICSLSLALLVFSGCQQGGSANLEEKLIGVWSLDIEEMKKEMESASKEEADGEPDAADAMAKQMMEGMLSNMKMSLEFMPEGKVKFETTMMGQANTQDGTWKKVSSSGKDLTISIAQGEDEPENATVTFVTDDSIVVLPPEKQQMPGGDGKMRMSRVKK